ncbi:general substrate transporter [Aspergillus germanicus]
MNALQISPAWKEYYDNPQSARLGTINAMFVVGKILGMIFVAPFSNRFSRKLPLILAMMICVAGAGIQAGAVNFGMLVFSRCQLGLGSSLMMLPGPIIIAEMAYPTHRGKLTAMFNVFYYYGAILAAWSTFGTLKLDGDWGWRIPTLLQGATPALQLLFIPHRKRENPEARDILVYHHAGGDQASPLVEVEMKQIQLNLRQEAESEGVAWSRVLRSPANRKRLLISAITGIASQWAGNAVISYYLTLALDKVGITDATQQAAINGGLQVFNLLAALGFGSLLVDRLWRRVLFLWSAVGMTCSYTALTIVNSRFAATQSKSLGYAFIPMIFLFYFHYNIAMNPLSVLVPARNLALPFTHMGHGIHAGHRLRVAHHRPVCEPRCAEGSRLAVLYCFLCD